MADGRSGGPGPFTRRLPPGPAAFPGSQAAKRSVDRQDARGGEGAANQGDQLLGPPRRRAEGTGGRRKTAAHELADGAPASRRPSSAAAEADGRAGAGAPAL